MGRRHFIYSYFKEQNFSSSRMGKVSGEYRASPSLSLFSLPEEGCWTYRLFKATT